MRESAAEASVLREGARIRYNKCERERHVLALRCELTEDERVCDHVVDSMTVGPLSVLHFSVYKKLTLDQRSCPEVLVCR